MSAQASEGPLRGLSGEAVPIPIEDYRRLEFFLVEDPEGGA